MELKQANKVVISAQGEKGEYQFSLPLGSALEEAVSVAGMFTASLSKALEEYKKKTEEQKEEKKEDGLSE